MSPAVHRVSNGITVGALVKKLETLPQQAIVLVEGCDCFGPCSGAERLPSGEVLINRKEGT